MTQAIATFRGEALRKVGDLLVKAGLRRQAATNFAWAVNREVTGLVGLTVITEQGNEEGLHITVSIGVRHEELEKLVAELTGQKFDPRTTATLGTALGYVAPDREYSEFPFTRDTAAPVAEEMVQMVLRYGVPWMAAHGSLDEILAALTAGKYTYRDAARLRIPLAHFLKGGLDSAKAVINQELLALGSSHGPVSEQYRHFAEGLLARLPS